MCRQHMLNMAEEVKQAVGSTKQEVGSHLGNGVSYSEIEENFNPLGYIYSLHMANMATEKAKQEIGSIKQEVASHLRSSAS